MEILYFLKESDAIRIPFYGYDRDLFNLLVAKGGVWDNLLHEFIFRWEAYSKQFFRDNVDIPFVWIDGNSSVSQEIYGFFECPWKISKPGNFPKKEMTKKANLPKAAVTSNSYTVSVNVFSRNWEEKLETELHSRKYSPRTMLS